MNFVSIILKMSLICNIPPAYIESILRTESTYCINTKNKQSSAMGCMQVLRDNLNVFQVADMRHNERSIKIGVDYLCKLKYSYKNTYLVRYYVGPNGDINSDKAAAYKNKLDIRLNRYFKIKEKI